MTSTRLPSLLLLLAAVVTGCNGAGRGPWAPTTQPFDPGCSTCTPLGLGELADTGGARLYVDTRTDDPPAQWVRCMYGFISCVDEGGEIPACAEQAECPEACKTELNARLARATGFDAQAAAVDQVFFDEGGLCATPENQEVSP